MDVQAAQAMETHKPTDAKITIQKVVTSGGDKVVTDPEGTHVGSMNMYI